MGQEWKVNQMRYYGYFLIGLVGMIFGAGMAEDPSMNLFYGIAVLYPSVGLLCYSMVRLVMRKHGH